MIIRLPMPAPHLYSPRLVVLAAILVSLVGCGSPVASVPPATIASFPGNIESPLLVDAAWLQARLANAGDNVRILDLSPPRRYAGGHVPGAVHAWWQDTMDPYYPVYGVVLANRNVPDARERYIQQLGIDSDTIVVAYDNDNNRYASRLIWTLRYFGHQNAAVLDGGLAAWIGFGGSVSREVETVSGSSPVQVRPQPGYIIGTRELRDRLVDSSVVVLDARSDDETRDDLNGSLRIGRIPGAVSVPWTAIPRDDAGRLKSPEELTALFVAAGITPDREVVIYARFGVETAQPWLVLKLLGYPNIRVYDQGWAEWASRPDLPIDPLTPTGDGTPTPTTAVP